MNAHPSSLSDRELLLLAAKAAGVVLMNEEKTEQPWYDDLLGCFSIDEDDYWNPLDEDGQALRLAVKLGLVIYMPDDDDKTVVARTSLLATAPRFMEEAKGSDPYAATRRAIVRAAAELAK